ncbi:hypothetical protein DLJ53_14955 [Acuticoccus sediminis]|uniref:DUF306 domain-containing protein n=1 Tax=Acuticoccus sediminis TaxID=2184697 RepID=A0A8B2NQG3_9HYPH|nr:hypothetical protein [Acuticoccus sediminis]RAI00560.1 hypothetical protein DLJ53_14955 [Acuticoccus sediminis]
MRSSILAALVLAITAAEASAGDIDLVGRWTCHVSTPDITADSTTTYHPDGTLEAILSTSVHLGARTCTIGGTGDGRWTLEGTSLVETYSDLQFAPLTCRDILPPQTVEAMRDRVMDGPMRATLSDITATSFTKAHDDTADACARDD